MSARPETWMTTGSESPITGDGPVHVVTIPEVGTVLGRTGGQLVHQIDNESAPRRRTVHGAHQTVGGEALGRRYGRGVHTSSDGRRRWPDRAQ